MGKPAVTVTSRCAMPERAIQTNPMRELETLASGKRDNTVSRVERPVTHLQCSHWRTMFPRWKAVIEFTRQWYAECGCLPTRNNIKEVFGTMTKTGDRWECPIKACGKVMSAYGRAAHCMAHVRRGEMSREWIPIRSGDGYWYYSVTSKGSAVLEAMK